MKQFVLHLTAIAALAFSISFFAGMSVSMMYQEHQALKPFIAAQEAVMEDVLSAAVETTTPDFS